MLTNFLSEINAKGISKASHFDVEFTLPRRVGRGTSITNKDIAIRCESADLPGRQMVTIDNKVYGPIYKTVYQSLFSDLNLTFLETKDMDFRYCFESWMEYIHPTGTTNNVEYYRNYTTGIKISQYDQIDDGSGNYTKTLTYHIYEAFPLNVNQLTGSWSDDGFHKLQVSFAYQRHTIIQEKVPGFENRTPPIEDTSSTTGGINPQLRR